MLPASDAYGLPVYDHTQYFSVPFLEVIDLFMRWLHQKVGHISWLVFFFLFLRWGCYYNRDFAKEMAILEVKDMKAHGHMLTVNPLAPLTRRVSMGNASMKTKLEHCWVAVFSLSSGNW